MQSERQPLYQQLQVHLRALLTEHGETLLPSERELASRFSVNRRTLRRALEEMESDGEIIRHPGRGYTGKKSLGKAHRSDRQYKIGFPIWLPHFEDMDVVHSQGRLATLQGIRQEFHNLGYELDVQFVGSIYQPDYALIERLLHQWDGYITEPMVRPDFADPFLPLRDYRVLIGYESGTTHNSVRIDFQQISKMAIRHLAERGARKILFMGGGEELYVQSLLRTIGVEEETTRYPGLQLIYEEHIPENYTAQGYSCVWEALRKGVEFDAVLCNTIYLATGAVRALLDGGRKVPQQVQVIGSGTSILHRYSSPRITTITAQEHYIGKLAARMMRNLQEKRGKPVAAQVIPTELIQGETTLSADMAIQETTAWKQEPTEKREAPLTR